MFMCQSVAAPNLLTGFFVTKLFLKRGTVVIVQDSIITAFRPLTTHSLDVGEVGDALCLEVEKFGVHIVELLRPLRKPSFGYAGIV